MLNKEKYDLTKLTFKIEGENNPSQVFKILDGTNVVFEKPILLNRAHLSLFLSWLEEYVPDILTDEEKAYLSTVIKPFREDVECIEKTESYSGNKEYIHMTMKRDDDYCELPVFAKGTMYKGMGLDKAYTLEDLGL